ncbi:Alkaline phosphatase synthesis transcriptional regulatory protein PhoP, partial [Haemophilus influenzae]
TQITRTKKQALLV